MTDGAEIKAEARDYVNRHTFTGDDTNIPPAVRRVTRLLAYIEGLEARVEALLHRAQNAEGEWVNTAHALRDLEAMLEGAIEGWADARNHYWPEPDVHMANIEFPLRPALLILKDQG